MQKKYKNIDRTNNVPENQSHRTTHYSHNTGVHMLTVIITNYNKLKTIRHIKSPLLTHVKCNPVFIQLDWVKRAAVYAYCLCVGRAFYTAMLRPLIVCVRVAVVCACGCG